MSHNACLRNQFYSNLLRHTNGCFMEHLCAAAHRLKINDVCEWHLHHHVRRRAVSYVEKAIKGYEAVGGTKINQSNSVGVQLGTWTNKTMSFNNVVEHWTERNVRWSCLGSGSVQTSDRIEKNWSEVTDKMTALKQTGLGENYPGKGWRWWCKCW